MTHLKDKSCSDCSKDAPALSDAEKHQLLSELRGWELIDNHHIQKTYTFPTYADALHWVNVLSRTAEEQNHHPDVYLSWGKVVVKIWTHAINDLRESDYILAAKLDSSEIDFMEGEESEG